MSLLWLVTRAFVEKVVNLRRRRSLMTPRDGGGSGPSLPRPFQRLGFHFTWPTAPPGVGVHRLGGGGEGEEGAPQPHTGPPVCVQQLYEDDAHRRTPTSRLRARLLFSAFICLTLFLFALSQLFFCHCLNEDLRGGGASVRLRTPSCAVFLGLLDFSQETLQTPAGQKYQRAAQLFSVSFPL